jgi:hypothetical protein
MGRTAAKPGATAARAGCHTHRSSETEGKTRTNCGRNPTAAAATTAAATTAIIATAASSADPASQSATADGRRATLDTSATEPADDLKPEPRWSKLDDGSAADGALHDL